MKNQPTLAKQSRKKPVIVKNGSTLLLRLAVLTFAAVIFGLCLVALPAGIASDAFGLYRWILLGLYVPAIPFFYAVFNIMKLLGYVDKNTAFSDNSVAALRAIKFCGLVIAGLFSAGMPYVYYVANKDDAPGVVAIGLIIIGASVAVSVLAAVLEQLLYNAITIKQENDLTV